MGRRSPPSITNPTFGWSGTSVPLLEAHLRNEVDQGNAEAAVGYFDQLLRRKRVPAAQVCTALLQLVCTSAPRHALYVLEQMSEARQLDVDDWSRIVRLLIMQKVDKETLLRFQETAHDILIFSDDGMHNYFVHLATLLNIELHEQVCGRGGGGDDGLEVSLITHKRELEAAALLCKKGSLVTPVFNILVTGMGGREGAQSEAEARQLAEAPVGLAPADALAAARAEIATLRLNASQQAAAAACLDRRLTLVQGPPGTGKTSLAVEVVRLWVQALGVKPVLVCADSNVAVDNIGVALVALGIAVSRPGRAEAIRPELQKFMPGSPEAIAAADVVLSTCVGAGAAILGKQPFPAVLIDEVGQSTEPSTLVPLTRGCRQLVLVGDHKQLRPTVLSEDAASRGLSLSLFERLIGAGVAPLLLDTQYRMHPSLAAFPSARFYRGRVGSGVAADARPQPRGFRWPSADVSAALVLSTSPEDGGAASKRNDGEAHAVIGVVRGVLQAGELRAADIGIVTPYASQVALLRQLSTALPNGRQIEIKSVDGFQGREKELIVFSAVRSGRSLGFVADARRLNVLLTRARRGLVVVGNPRALVHSRHWADWLLWIERHAAVAGHAHWQAPPRPDRGRDSRSEGSSDEDAMGRRRKRRRSSRSPSRSGSEEARGRGELSAAAMTRAQKRRAERERRRAAAAARGDGGDEGSTSAEAGGPPSEEEAAWRATLREAAERRERQLLQLQEAAEESDGEEDAAAAAARAAAEEVLKQRAEALAAGWARLADGTAVAGDGGAGDGSGGGAAGSDSGAAAGGARGGGGGGWVGAAAPELERDGGRARPHLLPQRADARGGVGGAVAEPEGGVSARCSI